MFTVEKLKKYNEYKEVRQAEKRKIQEEDRKKLEIFNNIIDEEDWEKNKELERNNRFTELNDRLIKLKIRKDIIDKRENKILKLQNEEENIFLIKKENERNEKIINMENHLLKLQEKNNQKLYEIRKDKITTVMNSPLFKNINNESEWKSERDELRKKTIEERLEYVKHIDEEKNKIYDEYTRNRSNEIYYKLLKYRKGKVDEYNKRKTTKQSQNIITPPLLSKKQELKIMNYKEIYKPEKHNKMITYYEQKKKEKENYISNLYSNNTKIQINNSRERDIQNKLRREIKLENKTNLSETTIEWFLEERERQKERGINKNKIPKETIKWFLEEKERQKERHIERNNYNNDI